VVVVLMSNEWGVAGAFFFSLFSFGEDEGW
jgi:hypothetical protein